MNYQEKLKSPKWQRKRLEVLNHANFRCQICGSENNTLNVHHSYYRKDTEPWDYPLGSMIAACEACHKIITEKIQGKQTGNVTEKSKQTTPNQSPYSGIPAVEYWLCKLLYLEPYLQKECCGKNRLGTITGIEKLLTHPEARQAAEALIYKNDANPWLTISIDDPHQQAVIENPIVQFKDTIARLLARECEFVLKRILNDIKASDDDQMSVSVRLRAINSIHRIRILRNEIQQRLSVGLDDLWVEVQDIQDLLTGFEEDWHIGDAKPYETGTQDLTNRD